MEDDMNLVDIELEKQEIRRNMEELESAENCKDIKRMLELATDDFVFVYRDVKLDGQTDIGEMLEESAKNYISSKHVPLRVEVSCSGDIAWLLGYELNKRARDNEIVETKQYYMIAFRKDRGKWKQVAVCLA
jgi:ketosteroid isomerase-like protein